MGLPRNMRSMYVHAYQSLVWNHAATTRAKLGLTVLEGDLVLPLDIDTESGEAKSGDTPEVHTVSAEDVVTSRFSFDEVVLPLPGECRPTLAHGYTFSFSDVLEPQAFACSSIGIILISCWAGRFCNGISES